MPCKHYFCYDCALKMKPFCKLCSEEIQEVTKIHSDVQKIFVCSKKNCNKSYVTFQDLKEHNRLRHDGEMMKQRMAKKVFTTKYSNFQRICPNEEVYNKILKREERRPIIKEEIQIEEISKIGIDKLTNPNIIVEHLQIGEEEILENFKLQFYAHRLLYVPILKKNYKFPNMVITIINMNECPFYIFQLLQFNLQSFSYIMSFFHWHIFRNDDVHFSI